MIDAISYVAVVLALLAMRLPAHVVQHHPAPLWHGMKEGFLYTFGFAPIRSILLLLAVVSIMGMPYTILMPIFAERILHGGPYTLGFLSTAAEIRRSWAFVSGVTKNGPGPGNHHRPEHIHLSSVWAWSASRAPASCGYLC